jgi:hypothetical protein
MGDPSQPPVEPVRLVLDFGESVEVDGSTVYDPTAEAAVPAVVLRMPRHRAAWFGLVLDSYARVCELAGEEVVAAERGPAWALSLAARSAGHVNSAQPRPVGRVTSGRRLAVAAVLRSAEAYDDLTTIAVVDAVARWLDEPGGDEYAYALLGAVTDGQTQLRAYGELIGTGGGR